MKLGQLLAGVVTTVLPLVASFSNIVTDFSTISNPSGIPFVAGQYSYGSESVLGGAFSLITTMVSGAGYAGWGGSVSGFPLILDDTSGSTFTSGTVTYSTDYLNLHPASNDTYAVLRYTVEAPVACCFQISGAFRGQDTGGTTTDVHILIDGVPVFGAEVSGYLDASKQTFSLNRPLNFGDTIDFAVGFGTNGSYFNDSTGLQGTIVDSPEPASVILILSGIAVCGLFRKRLSTALARGCH